MNLADATPIARRYATAIFDLAREAGQEDVVVAEMEALAAALKGSAPLAAVLANPLVTRAQKTMLMKELAAKTSTITQQSVRVLASSGRAEFLPAVAERLRAQLRALRGEVVAKVVSARPLNAATQAQLVTTLSKASGQKMTLECRVSPALLGGITVQIDSQLLDASIAGRLARLRTNLIHAADEAA